MHRYWAAHRPEDYERLGLGQDWVETFHDEVMWATGQAAEMVERLADHIDANPGSQLWIASSMGQRATMAETLETQLYLSHPARFLEAMGLPGKDGWQRRPAMLPQFNLVVEADYVEPFRDALRTVRVGGQPLHFKRSDNGFFSLDFGQPNPAGLHGTAQDARRAAAHLTDPSRRRATTWGSASTCRRRWRSPWEPCSAAD